MIQSLGNIFLVKDVGSLIHLGYQRRNREDSITMCKHEYREDDFLEGMAPLASRKMYSETWLEGQDSAFFGSWS